MSEKNTSSILQSIKEKMHRFDKKEAAPKLNVEEFEYSARPSTKEAPVAADLAETNVTSSQAEDHQQDEAASLAVQNSSEEELKFEEDLGLGLASETNAEIETVVPDNATEVVAQPRVSTNQESKPFVDDLDFSNPDSFSLPSELSSAPKQEDSPQPQALAEPIDPTVVKAASDDLDILFGANDEDSTSQPVQEQSVTAQAAFEVNNVVAPSAMAPEAAQSQQPAAEPDDLNLDDLDVLLSQESDKKVVAPRQAEAPSQPQSQVQEKHEDDFDIEALEAQIRQQAEQQKISAAAKQVEDISQLEAKIVAEDIAKKEGKTSEKPVEEETTHQQDDEEEASESADEEPEEESYDEEFELEEDESEEELEEELEEESEEEELEEDYLEEFEKDGERITASRLIDISNAKAPILHETTIKQASDSIKKLVNAHSSINAVSNFSKDNALLAELAANILEPKLESWLNENLPHLVEEIVREEIRKILPKDKN